MFKSSQTKGLEGYESGNCNRDLSLPIKYLADLAFMEGCGVTAPFQGQPGSGCSGDSTGSSLCLDQGCVGTKGRHVL